ncbi:MAG TPA: hypothetical protein RMH99_05960 [Sandaracinaceae bacterium LLY-WYZ-13_1]|nr:hypothetical protein [Sandaracinaceae bacterium LLY-WYZ-13_1]
MSDDIGTITEIEPEDQLGWIELANGERIRFGGTACKGFVPAVGMSVRVLGTRPGYRGVLKATGLEKVSGAAAAAAPAAPADAAADEPRTALHALQQSGVRSEELLQKLLGKADVDDALHADLEALCFEVRPGPGAEVGCGNPWVFVVAMDGGRNAYGLYTHPLLAEHPQLPWVFWDHERDTVRALADDTAGFLQGLLATASASGVDPTVVQRAHRAFVELGMPDAQGQPFGDGVLAEWLPPEGDALRPVDAYLAETDGAEMERGLLAHAWRGDARAVEALRSLYETWGWTPPR